MCEKMITRSLRANEESFRKFVELCNKEGRKQAKMFELLLYEYENCVCKYDYEDKEESN